MLRSLSLAQDNTMTIDNIINDNCKNRIKPTLLRDVKTEALLVFARTALERFFLHLDENDLHPTVGTDDDTIYVYNSLKELRVSLQECVVNADYLINLVKSAEKYPELRKLAKHEEPLMNYYDAMAHKVANHFLDKPAYLPEFLVICVLSHWILEEEKSIELYPFLQKFDFVELIDKFETYREDFRKNDECIITDLHKVSVSLVEKLKAKKYKANTRRVSKTRKKK